MRFSAALVSGDDSNVRDITVLYQVGENAGDGRQKYCHACDGVVSGPNVHRLNLEWTEASTDDSDEKAGQEVESIDLAAAAIQTASLTAGSPHHEGWETMAGQIPWVRGLLVLGRADLKEYLYRCQGRSQSRDSHSLNRRQQSPHARNLQPTGLSLR